MSTPNLLSSYASSYSQDEQERLEARFQAIESYLGKSDANRYKSIVGGQFETGGSSTETITTNGAALDPNKLLSKISAAGAQTRTLAAPNQDGKLKILLMTVHGGNVTMAADNIQDGTGKTATFAAVGDCLILLSAGGVWINLGGNAAIA